MQTGSPASVRPEPNFRLAQKLEPPKRLDWNGAAQSSGLVSFVLFVALNWLMVLVPSPDLFDWPNHNHCWWILQDWRKLKQPPDVVLIGSSVVYKAVNGADANLLNQPIDEALHHRSFVLEQALSQKSKQLRSSFCLCTPAQMPSDTYAFHATLFKDNFKPKIMVWGIFARDFLDTTSSAGPLSSAVARHMNRISMRRVVDSDRKSFWNQVSDGLAEMFPLIKKRDDVLCLVNDGARTVAKKELDEGLGLKEMRNGPSDGMLINNPFVELVPGALVTKPDYQQSPPKDSSSCDRNRFRYFDEHIFKLQCDYFERVLVRSQSLGIRPVVIYMPVTEDNLKEMPPGSRERVMETVQAIMRRHNVEFHDFSGKGLFARNEFGDFMHLNCVGASKLMRALADNVDWDQDRQGGKMRDQSTLSNTNTPL